MRRRGPREFGRAMAWPAVARSYVESFERARAEHAGRLRTRLPGEDARAAPSELPGSRPRAPAAHDRSTRHPPARVLRRSALRRRLLPRRQRARAPARWRSSRTRAPRTGGRARARDALPRLREPRVQPDKRALPQLHVVLAALDREPAARRTATGARSGRSARSSGGPRVRAGRASAATSSRARCPPLVRFTSPRAWAFALLGIDEYLRAFQGDSERAGRADAARGAAVRSVPAKREQPTGRGSRTA